MERERSAEKKYLTNNRAQPTQPASSSHQRARTLKQIKKAIGKGGITNGLDIDKIMKAKFGKRYKGIYLMDEPGSKLPPLKDNEIAVLNRNVHWFGIYKKDGKLYETDSYGIDNIPHIPDKKPPVGFRQGADGKDKQDCGSRLITNLLFDAL